MLKINDAKTEVLHFSSRLNRNYCPLRVTVGDCEIVPVDSARNLGAMFDKHVTMDDRVKMHVGPRHPRSDQLVTSGII